MAVSLKRLALVLPAALAATALTAISAPAALATTDGPPAEMDLSDCPDTLPVGADPADWYCNVLVTNAGTMKIGKIQQQITAPMRITLIAGYDRRTNTNVSKFIKMRSKPMTVTGGALGIPGTEGVKLLGLQVKPESAGDVELTIWERKATIDLKVKLINPLLGNNCYVGSNANPIKLNLDIPTIEAAPGGWIKTVATDTTFAAPGVTGCGVAAPIANFRGGLPSASGKNSASLVSYFGGKSYSEMYPQMKIRTR